MLYRKVLLLSLTQKVGEVKRIIDVEVAEEISIVCMVETREMWLKHTYIYLYIIASPIFVICQ
jgi:hypothetical protein